MYFQPPLRIVRSGLHPKSSSGANDSAYSDLTPEAGGWGLEDDKTVPSASNRPSPASDTIVGATSTSDTGAASCVPGGSPAPVKISGTRSVVSYVNRLWLISPCSPNASP